MKKNFLIFLFVILFTSFIFREYTISGKTPFPGNLLLSFYQPWASYTWDGYTNGIPSKPIGFDNLRMFYPLRHVVNQALKTGNLPLWNPYSFAGNVVLGAYQSAVFFPLGFLFLLLPQIHAWSIIIMLAPILTFIFTYIFLQEIKLGKRASLFGAVLFAFSGIMIVWWQEMFMSVYSTLPLPLIFYAILRIYKDKKILPALILIAAFLFSIFSGYFQTTFYLFLISSMWTIFLFVKEKEKKAYPLLSIGFAMIVSILIAGIQLFPAYEAYSLSARGQTDVKEMFEQFFIPLPHLITFLIPDYFGNPATHTYSGKSFYHEKVVWITIPGIIFALYALATTKKKNYMSLFFIASGIFFLSLALSLPSSWFLLYQLKLPLVSEMTPSRIVYLSSFCFSVLAAIGLKRFLLNPQKKQLLLILNFALLVFVIFILIALQDFQYKIPAKLVSLRNSVIPLLIFISLYLGLFLGLVKKNLSKFTFHFIFLLSLVSIVYFSTKYLYFSKPKYTFPPTPVIQKLQEISGINRYTSIGKGYIDRNFANFFKLYSVEGYESFNIKRYNELIMSSHRRGELPLILNRADASLYPAKDLVELSQDGYTLKIMQLLGVRFVIAKKQPEITSVPEIFKLVWSDNIFDIYEYSSALPRFFLTSSYIVESEPQQILDHLYDEKFDLSKRIVLETDIGQQFKPISTSSAVILNTYQPEKISFTVETENDTLLFLSDNYYPGWVAKIDDVKTQIYRANYTFRSIVVPKGKHAVIFSYEPEMLKFGALSTTVGLLLLGFYYLIRKKKIRN